MKRFTANIAAFSDSRARAAGLRRGFTLVEVMVAIAIALALIVGISQIFAMAQQTTGGGTTLVKFNGVQRRFNAVAVSPGIFSRLISTAQSPGLVIASCHATAAFRNKIDHDTSRDPGTPPDPRSFNNPSGGSPTILDFTALSVPNRAYSTSSRIHRLDRLCMFEPRDVPPADRGCSQYHVADDHAGSVCLVRPPGRLERQRDRKLGSDHSSDAAKPA